MSDSTLNRFLGEGTNAQMLAFTPSPPTPASGPTPLYLFYDTTNSVLNYWTGAAWAAATSGGSGTVTHTGTLTSGKTIIGNGSADITVSSLTASVVSSSSGTLAAASTTGSGNVVLATSPTLVTPALGTPASGTLTNATGLPLSTGVTGTLPVGNGGTGQTTYTDGQLLIGNSTGNTLTKATITAGSGISVTNGGGSITIAASGSSGKIAQVVTAMSSAVATGTGRIPNDDTIPQNTEGDEYLTCTITPTNASSKLVIQATLAASASAGASTNMALFQDANADAIAGAIGVTSSSAGWYMPITLPPFSMTAGTTSATTFKLRASASAGTLTVNGFGGARVFATIPKSGIVITEVLP